MKFTISEMAKLSGVSVRTLHYYDEIELLKPSEVVLETGYRYYDEQTIQRLQQILFYRELDFPLKEIVKIMNSSEYNKQDAFERQRELLILKRKRLNKLISLLEANLKGENTMSFKEFDKSEVEHAKEKYAEEVLSKWGNTKAYTQSEEKTSKYTKEDWANITNRMNELIRLFADHLGEDPRSEEVQNLVAKWQQFITESYYDCTKEILAGLGEMYAADERFKANIDQFGDGTAAFMNRAIQAFCVIEK